MEREQVLNQINAIGNTEDSSELLTMLNVLRDDVCTLFDENEQLKQSNEEYVQANKDLQRTNREFFLEIGTLKSKSDRLKDETGEGLEETKPKRFEDLFNEKGELK